LRLAAALLVLSPAAPAAVARAAEGIPDSALRAAAVLQEVPALTRLVIEGDAVRAATEADSAGQSQWVTFDRKANRWSVPTRGPAPALTHVDSLGGVRVFDGGLFDKFRGDALALGDGTTLAKRDSGYALIGRDGADLGWPTVTQKEVEMWSGKVRQGLPSEYPEARVQQLFDQGRLRNEPGPTMLAGGMRWFGLKGGFTGGSGQLGGLVSWSAEKKQFEVHRHFLLVDASVTRIFARPGEVWIGTGRFGERALEGITGLLLYRPARKEWRQFSTRNSGISGDLVWDIAEANDGLWVTTDRGISRYDWKSKNWKSWYWRSASKGREGFVLSSEPAGNLFDQVVH
jgi:hypothetical protein